MTSSLPQNLITIVKDVVCSLSIFIFLNFSINANGQETVIAAFDRLNIVGPTLSDNAPNLNSIGFTRGQGISISNGSEKFNSQGWNGPNTLSAAIQAENYVEWSIKGDPNFAIELYGIKINLSRNNSGPTRWIIQYSTDAFTTGGLNLIPEQTLNNGNRIDTFMFDNLNVESEFGGAITFRLYAWSARNPSGRLAIEGNMADSVYTIINPGVTLTGNIEFDGLIYSSNIWIPTPPSPLTSDKNAWIKDGIYLETQSVELQSLVINPNAELIIEKNGSLVISENLTTNNGLTLESDSKEYSSLIVKGNVEGNVIYNRHVNINAPDGQNDLISAPVTGQTFGIFSLNNLNIVENPNNPSQKLFGPFDKDTGTYLTYNTIDNLNTILEPAVGYRAASTDNGNFRFEGVAETQTITIPISNSGFQFREWNLIGNPYPSYIKLSDFLSNNIDNLEPNYAGIFGYDGNASDGWTVWNLAYSQANPDAQLAPGQGFLIAAKTGGGVITYTPSMRSIGPGDDFILGRKSQIDQKSIEWLEMILSDGRKQSVTQLYLTNEASYEFDLGYDTAVFGGVAPSFSIFSRLTSDQTSMDLAIQSIDTLNPAESVVVPLGIHKPIGNHASISARTTKLSKSIDVILEDRIDNQFFDIRNATVELDASIKLDGVGRYYLHLTRHILTDKTSRANNLEILVAHENNHINIYHLPNHLSTIKLFDLQGVMKFSGDTSGDPFYSIPTQNLNNGLYVLTIQSRHATINRKILLN